MRSILLIIALCLCWFPSMKSMPTDCNGQSHIRCQKLLTNIGWFSSTHLESPTELRHSCRAAGEAFRCFEKLHYICGSTDEGELFFDMMGEFRNIVEYMCSSKFEKAYERHFGCLRETKPHYMRCQDAAEVHRKDLIAGGIVEAGDPTLVCITHNITEECVTAFTEEKCGKDSADFLRNLIHEIMSSSVKKQCFRNAWEESDSELLESP